MKLVRWLATPRSRLDVVAGFIDGILNALTLAAGKLFTPGGEGATVAMTLKIGAATSCTTLFVFFVAHYADLRAELVHAERELNLLAHGRLATTRLGQKILRESLSAAVLASICGLIGATIPLGLSLILPAPPILGLIITIALLGILGVVLAGNLFGSRLAWSMALMAGGLVLAIIGAQLKIVG